MPEDQENVLRVPVGKAEIRFCNKCRNEMKAYWTKQKNIKAGYSWHYICQKCAYKLRVEKNNQPHYSDTVRPPKPDEIRYCKTCGHKLFCGWHKDHKCKLGGSWDYRCLPCLHKRQMERDPSFYHVKRLRYSYGMTKDQHNEIYAKQNGVCAICKKPPKTRSGVKGLYVDHNHETGKPRALLCQHCNSALGFASDSPELLRAMADYLEYWEDQERESSNVTA